MLTPRFEISQTEQEVTIIIHAPYANIKETEVYVEGTDFRFYSTPYYLHLQLPGEIEENDSSSGSYECEKGDFTLKFSKVHKGEYFENLDMITTLLTPAKRPNKIAPNIEVIGNPSANLEYVNEEANQAHNNTDTGDEWFIPQNCPTENITMLPGSVKYGFANKISEALTAFEDAWLKEIIDLPTPDITPQQKRRSLREQRECLDFNEEHYLADLMEPDYIEGYISFTPEWDKLKKGDIILNGTEIDLLKEFPNKEFLLTSDDVHKLCLSLVDILFGSCYNHRTTLGENTVESSWPINKLSSTLCWFDEFSNIEDVVRACIRRSLCYPLFRNWYLSIKVLEDVKKVLKLGKKYVIKRFCEIHSLFNNACEPRYILNQLYIRDYLIWLQQIPESLIENLEASLSAVHPSKEDMQLDLIELEQAAYSVAEEEDLVIENTVHQVIDQVQGLTINDHNKEPLSGSSGHNETESDSDSESSTTTTSSSSNSDTESDSDSAGSTTSSSDSNSTDSETDSEDSNIGANKKADLDSDDLSEPEEKE